MATPVAVALLSTLRLVTRRATNPTRATPGQDTAHTGPTQHHTRAQPETPARRRAINHSNPKIARNHPKNRHFCTEIIENIPKIRLNYARKRSQGTPRTGTPQKGPTQHQKSQKLPIFLHNNTQQSGAREPHGQEPHRKAPRNTKNAEFQF